jgi:3-methyladenine DNA glycosylase AlkC
MRAGAEVRVAQAWKDSYDAGIVRWVAEQLADVLPDLDVDGFVAECLDGFEELELMARAQRIAEVMADRLPEDPHAAIPLVAAAMGPVEADLPGITSFRLMPHSIVIGTRGLPAFEASMAAQHALTTRFTAEFSIRPFLAAEPARTLAQLRTWAGDDDERVRRLVSEGTRPRLPWAPRLPAFIADPGPVIELLDLLCDDEALLVRRSVANNLNDISKDHPRLAVDVAARWWEQGGERRRWVVRHGLRTLVKRGDPAALAILGIAAADHLAVRGAVIEPATVAIGERVRVAVEVADTRASGDPQRVAVDLVVHFVKASGATSAKVFKGGVRELGPGQAGSFACTVSLAVHTTRTPYRGWHPMEAQVNGVRTPIGGFEVR